MKNRWIVGLIAALGLLLTPTLPAQAQPAETAPQRTYVSKSKLTSAEVQDIVAASKGAPIEIVVHGATWSGGVVLDHADSSSQILTRFLRDARALREGGAQFTITGPATIERAQTAVKLADARSPLQGAGAPVARRAALNTPPTVPQSGQFEQFNMMGDVVTRHQLTGLGGSSYQATRVDYPGGTYSMQPNYGYEHDYKILNNGYTSTTPDYAWESNLPGAYRDTRASDGDDQLDFTIGSAFTWQLNPSTTYLIETVVQGGSATQSTGHLTGSVLPNDGMPGGCAFEFSQSGSPVSAPNSWCFGLSGSAANVSYISLNGFTVNANGTCHRWVFSQGSSSCV